MRYDVQITFDDYKAAQKLHGKRKTILSLCVGVVLLVLASIKEALTAGIIHAVIFAVFLVIIFSVVFGVLHLFVRFYLWKRIYQKHKLLQKTFQYEFTEEAFCITSEYSTSAIPWHEFYQWKEGKDLFLIYQTNNLFHMIPKRILTDQEAQNQLRNILTEKLGRAGK